MGLSHPFNATYKVPSLIKGKIWLYAQKVSEKLIGAQRLLIVFIANHIKGIRNVI